jgi:hypothetical protein
MELVIIFHFDILPNYYFILNCWNFRTLNFRRHLDALFPVYIFEGEINCHSIMDTVGIRVLRRLIREFSTFSMSSALRHSPSHRWAIAATDIFRYFDVFSRNSIIFLMREMFGMNISRLI